MKNILVFFAKFAAISGFLLLPQLTSQVKAAGEPFPVGQWTLDSIVDRTGVLYSTNGICIQPNGKYYATTSGEGAGHWYMKDNRIHLHGNYASSLTGGAVNDAFELMMSSQRVMTGYLQEWNDSGSYNGYYISKWKFSSATCNPPSK
jgi:hypothetical protein